MKKLIAFLFVLSCASVLIAQNIGIGTSTPGALLEIRDLNVANQQRLFLTRSSLSKLVDGSPILLDTVFQVSNNGNVGIGAGNATGLLDIFGKRGDSVLLNLHASPNPMFGSDAVLRFSGTTTGQFDIAAHFTENNSDSYLSMGKLNINRLGSVVIGMQPFLGFNPNSLTINHNSFSTGGKPLIIAEYGAQIPVSVSLLSLNNPNDSRGWNMDAYAVQDAASAYIKFYTTPTAPSTPAIVIAGNKKLGVNTSTIAAQTQMQINGLNNANSTPLLLGGVQEYADNAAAITAGLPAGAVYRTGDLLKIVH